LRERKKSVTSDSEKSNQLKLQATHSKIITLVPIVDKHQGIHIMSTFAIITKEELNKFLKLNATITSMVVYCCLLEHCIEKDTCFPNIDTIMEYTDHQISKRTLYRSLKWLEDNRFIVRDGKRSLTRYKIIHRNKNKIQKNNKEKSQLTSVVSRKNNINNSNSFNCISLIVPTVVTSHSKESSIIKRYLDTEEPLSVEDKVTMKAYIENNKENELWLKGHYIKLYNFINDSSYDSEDESVAYEEWTEMINKSLLEPQAAKPIVSLNKALVSHLKGPS
jgi:hypothetical protein